jgi:hypothetical protein
MPFTHRCHTGKVPQFMSIISVFFPQREMAAHSGISAMVVLPFCSLAAFVDFCYIEIIRFREIIH